MVEYTYSYTIANLKFLNELYKYIKSISGLPSDFYILNEDTVKIIYTTELTGGQITTLNTAISNYTPPQTLSNIEAVQNLFIDISDITSTTYTLSCLNIVNREKLYYIDIWSGIDKTGTYDIKIYDVTHNTIMKELTGLNNTEEQLIKIENLSNISYMLPYTIEIHVRVSNSSIKCHIKSCLLVFGELMW